MIHPEATREECLEEIGALEREVERFKAQIAQLRAENWELKQANSDLLMDMMRLALPR